MSKKKAMFFKGASGGEAFDYATPFMTATGIPNDSTIYYSGTAQEITGAELWTAVQDLVTGLDTNGTLELYDTIYPFVGGTLASHKYNLKTTEVNLDTDAAFRLTESGTVTHSKDGVQSDGSTGYFDTHMTPEVVWDATLMRGTLMVYSPTADPANSRTAIGGSRGMSGEASCGIAVTNWKCSASINGGVTIDGSPLPYNTPLGVIFGTRGSSTNMTLHITNVTGEYTDENTSLEPSLPPLGASVFMLASRQNSSAVSFHTGVISLAATGKPLTSAQMTADAAVFQSFQTALGRNV